MNKIATRSADQTRALGAALANAVAVAMLDRAIVIALNGDLGAGKTTFVSGFLRALGVTGAVRSPTYTLVEPYELGARTVYHLDLYRLADSHDLEMLAPRDLLNPGSVLLIEWAERGGQALPPVDLSLTFHYPIDSSIRTSRSLDLIPRTTTGKELAANLQRAANEAGLSP
jgi:tRNA threonylcarbamoyladenosine biosynthesis protein TsaE